jgi:hypothetical protein
MIRLVVLIVLQRVSMRRHPAQPITVHLVSHATIRLTVTYAPTVMDVHIASNVVRPKMDSHAIILKLIQHMVALRVNSNVWQPSLVQQTLALIRTILIVMHHSHAQLTVALADHTTAL